MAAKPMTVRLVCWNDRRAEELTDELEAARFTVDSRPFAPSTLKEMATSRPAAVVIDLGRLPSNGRDVGVAVRARAGTRTIPLVFVDGPEAKVAKVRELLPDAAYADRAHMVKALRTAVRKPVVDPIVPASMLAGYSGTPLPKKLGIKPGSQLGLVDPPPDVDDILGELPEGVRVARAAQSSAEVTLWFVRSTAELEERIDKLAAIAGDGRLWICWPKKSSGIASDVTQTGVRERGLATGLVDFKICAVDATWSGLCFTRRKASTR